VPSITSSYIYTFFALAIVGTLLICTFNAFTVFLKEDVKKEQLKNLLEHVAAESCELISTAMTNNSTITVTLNIPSLVGNQRYWIQLRNDSSLAWVEGDFGTSPVQTGLYIFIPGIVSASGQYISGYGVAVLECQVNGTTTCLNLSGGR